MPPTTVKSQEQFFRICFFRKVPMDSQHLVGIFAANSDHFYNEDYIQTSGKYLMEFGTDSNE